MKRRFTILTAAFMLLAFLAIPMGMIGQTSVTWPGTTALPGTATAVANDQNITIMVSSTNTYTNPIRIYANTTITIEAQNDAKILSVNYEASSTGNYVTVAQNATVTPNVTPTVNGKIVTWSYTESANVTEFTFTPSAQTRSNGITITYIIPGATPTCATPTFSPAAGTYTQAQNVSISCATEGATIYYTTNGDTPTTNSAVYTEAISVSSNMTIKAMATAEGYDNSAVATAEYAFITLDHAGTLEDPYTVADARAAIDANTGTQNVYAIGIVSAIVTAYDSGFENITFDMVDEEGNEATLRAYRCGGDEAADVAVGDIAVVYGSLTKYGSTYEFGQGCQLVSLTHPVITVPTVTVTPNTINAPAEGADGTLALTYENITDFTSFDYYFCDANGGELQEDPNWIYAEINEENAVYSLDYLIDANDGEARTAYMKVYTFDDDEEEVYAIVTVNQEAYVAPVLDYAELPFEFDGGKADIETTDGLTQDGLDSDYSSSPKLKFKTAGTWVILHFNERPGTLTFDIKGNGFSGGTFTVQTSVDGETYTDLQNYTDANFGNTLHSEEFTNLGENVRYIKWIYTQKSSGNVALGNIALAKYVEPVLVASITVDPDEVSVDAEDHDGTLDLTYENLTITDMYDFDIQYYDAEGEEANEPDWMEVLVAEQDPEIGEGYVVSYWIMENEGTEARTVYFKVYAMDDETNLVYSNLVTVNQAAPETPANPGTWVLTSLADLTEDDIFVIVGNNGDTYAMSNDEGTQFPPSTVEVIVTEGTLSGEPDANIQWNLEITEDGYVFYPNGTTETWLYCTNDNNGVRVGTGDAKHFTFDETYGNGYLTTTETTAQRWIGIYNSQDWRCYKLGNNGAFPSNIAGQTFAFYKKVTETVTYTLEINGYTEGSNGGYYLIASPVNVNPENVEGMTTGNFDLYYFDEAQDNEWINYKGENGDFNLVPGKGYLYAKQATTEGEIFHFELTGTPYGGNGTIELNYTDGGDFPGWNLIGNPYNEEAGLNLPFYRMNTEGTEVEPVSQGTVNPMEGVFVIAQTDPETGDIINAQFTAGMGSNFDEDKLVLNVSRNRGNVVDRAIVRFGQGGVLPKFQLNENSTKLYIVEGDNEYAVVRSANEGEMPVNFKASENGNYTLSVNAENVEMEYLHLIDNMTGTDVDLLATPSYSFEARTNDYESRFRLVFSGNTNVGSSTSSETFAFFNGNSWVINNEGEATLQVIDMMGRVLSNEQINGSYNNSLNLSAGVYVLRLSNGNTVKTQKVVVD